MNDNIIRMDYRGDDDFGQMLEKAKMVASHQADRLELAFEADDQGPRERDKLDARFRDEDAILSDLNLVHKVRAANYKSTATFIWITRRKNP